MVKPGQTEVPYDYAEALLVPRCPNASSSRSARITTPSTCDSSPRSSSRGGQGWRCGLDRNIHTARLIPVESIAPEYDIETLAAKIINEHFPRMDSAAGTHRWAARFAVRVHYEEHSREAMLAMGVEKKIADMVPKEYGVNLTNPELTILVVVAEGSAMMSVVKGYGANEKFHHFRIHSVAELNRTSGGGQPSYLLPVLDRATAA